LTGGQGVAGSNPASPTKAQAVSDSFEGWKSLDSKFFTESSRVELLKQ